jgi:hypothetical protein
LYHIVIETAPVTDECRSSSDIVFMRWVHDIDLILSTINFYLPLLLRRGKTARLQILLISIVQEPPRVVTKRIYRLLRRHTLTTHERLGSIVLVRCMILTTS